MHQLTVTNLNKTIGSSCVLKNINLHTESGKIYGFVGHNGSGKTMLFRAILGLIRINSGSIYYDGKELFKDIKFLPSAGATIENMGLYSEFNGFQNLKAFSKIKNIISDDEIRNAIRRVGLDPYDKRKYYKYSLGMKQRLVLAQAFMEKPEILLLDEPTNAIDENGVDDVRKIILEEKERGAMVLIASHNKEDIQMLCDKVFYLSRGELTEEDKNI